MKRKEIQKTAVADGFRYALDNCDDFMCLFSTDTGGFLTFEGDTEHKIHPCFVKLIKSYLDDAYVQNYNDSQNAIARVRGMLDSIYAEWEQRINPE